MTVTQGHICYSITAIYYEKKNLLITIFFSFRRNFHFLNTIPTLKDIYKIYGAKNISWL